MRKRIRCAGFRTRGGAKMEEGPSADMGRGRRQRCSRARVLNYLPPLYREALHTPLGPPKSSSPFSSQTDVRLPASLWEASPDPPRWWSLLPAPTPIPAFPSLRCNRLLTCVAPGLRVTWSLLHLYCTALSPGPGLAYTAPQFILPRGC